MDLFLAENISTSLPFAFFCSFYLISILLIWFLLCIVLFILYYFIHVFCALAHRALFFLRPQRQLKVSQFVSLCFEPSYPQRITPGLNTNFTVSPSDSFHRSSYHKSCCCFFCLFIFRGHSTWEPASSRLIYFILRAYTGTSVSQSQHRKKSGEVSEKMQVNGPEG